MVLPFIVILILLLVEANKNLNKNDITLNEKLSAQVINNLVQHLSLAENVSDSVLQNSMLINFLSKPYQSRIGLEYYSTAIYDYVKISTGITSEFRMRIYLENETIPIGYSTFYHIQDAISIPLVKEFYESNDKVPLWVDGSSLVESPKFFPE